MTADDAFLEVVVVAKRLKRHPETIRRYIRTGVLSAVHPAGVGRWLVPESAIAAFLQSTKLRPTGRPFKATARN